MGGAQPARSRAEPASRFGRSGAIPCRVGRRGARRESPSLAEHSGTRTKCEVSPATRGAEWRAGRGIGERSGPELRSFPSGGVSAARRPRRAPRRRRTPEGDDDGHQSPDRGESQEREAEHRPQGHRPDPLQRPPARPLRPAEVRLPGEDPAEVQAELDGWRGDWQPLTHTRARPRRPRRRRHLATPTAPSAPGVRRPSPPRRRRRPRPSTFERLAAVERGHRPLRRRPGAPSPCSSPARGPRPPAPLLGRAGRLPRRRPGRLGPAVPPAADDPAGLPARHP